jgi:hypothetical protein
MSIRLPPHQRSFARPRLTRPWGLALALILAPLALAPSPAAAIIINLTYETPDVTRPDVVRPFTQAEIDVIDQARHFWEQRIDSPETFGISCAVVDLPGSRLGEARPDPADPSGTPVGGRILFDARTGMGQKVFFVDPTPDESSEYQAVHGGPPTALATNDPTSPAYDRFDLLTVAIHELGHVLGMSSSYANYAGQIQPSPDTSPNQKVYVFAGLATLGDPVADYRAGVFFTNGAIYLPTSDEDPNEGGSTGGDPSHLDDIDFGGAAAGLFPLNVMNESLQLGERFLIADPELDVLADAYALSALTLAAVAVCGLPTAATADWFPVGTNPIPAADGAVGHDLATDGVLPVVAFVADDAGSREVRVAEYAGGPSWTLLGPSPSAGVAFIDEPVALAFSGPTAHVLYASGFGANVHLMQRGASSWTEFGSPGYSSPCSAHLALRLVFDGTTPHVVTYGAGGCGLGTDYGFWNGAAWEQRPSTTGFPGQLTSSGNGQPGLTFSDRAYIGLPENDAGTARIAVQSWDSIGSSWADLVGPIQENATTGFDEHMALASDPSGNLYAAWSEQIAAGGKVIFVKRYDVVQQTWTLLGGTQASGPDSATFPSLALIAGVPWLAHLEETGGVDLAYVRRFDSAQDTWTVVGQPLNQSPTVDAFAPVIVGIGSTPYVAFREGVAFTPQDLYVVRLPAPSPVPTLGVLAVLLTIFLLLATAWVIVRRGAGTAPARHCGCAGCEFGDSAPAEALVHE